MQYINWNIKCYCNIDKIIDFLLSQADEKQCIIALQEVMPEKAERILHRMSDRYSVSYSMDHRKAGNFDTDNRKLGIMILVSKDMDIVETNVLDRCLFPERTLYATVRNGENKLKVVTFHSVTGVSFKMGKAVQFRSFAESIRAYGPDIVSLDANEPKKDHYDMNQMEFFDQGDAGKGAKVFFDELTNQGLVDAYASDYKSDKYIEGEPLTVSHVLPNGINRRYDFVFVNGKAHISNAEYLYEESCAASSDHAMIKVDFNM